MHNPSENSTRTAFGVLFSFDLDGTHSLFWVFQDRKYIFPNTKFTCQKCGLRWDKDRQPEEPTSWRSDCASGKHNFQLDTPEVWSSVGSHILRDGDELKIFDKVDPQVVLWNGKVQLRHFSDYTETAFGRWVRSEQVGVDRDVWAYWFYDRYPALLIANSDNNANSDINRQIIPRMMPGELQSFLDNRRHDRHDA